MNRQATIAFILSAALSSLTTLAVACGDGPDLDCEIAYLNPSQGQCLCAGVLADPSFCPECTLLPCGEPQR